MMSSNFHFLAGGGGGGAKNLSNARGSLTRKGLKMC